MWNYEGSATMNPREVKIYRFALWFAFSSFAFYFFEAVTTDLVYSNCYGVGSSSMYCLTPYVQYLYHVVGPVGHGYFLGMYATPDGMGIIAGICFIGIGLSLFLLKLPDWKHALRSAFLGMSVSYSLMMLGFAVFYPYCLEVQCRVTNYLPWMSYDVAFYGVIVVIGACLASYLWEWYS